MVKNYISQLRELLRSEKMTQKELSERLGVTFAALNRWLNGHAVPHPKRVSAIAKLHRTVVGYRAFTPEAIQKLIRDAARPKRKNIWKLVSTHQDLQNELVLEHTYNSTTIEGNTMTKQETEAVVFQGRVIPDHPMIEHLEMTNHAAVLKKILMGEYQKQVTEELIRLIHRDLMQGIREDAGHYSKHHRAIRGLDIALTHPQDIPEEMTGLIRNWKRRQNITIKDIADFHVSFELFHPFGDGNGRVGRLLMTLQCLEANYLPLVIENKRKFEYYEVLEYAQKKTDGPFIAFLVEELKRTDQLFRKYGL